ncbi:MAG TPA: protein kinase, partial [Gemmatimonadaceae bacterium]|nr:protein kinase [Gemmatimonadaceae bacterium]
MSIVTPERSQRWSELTDLIDKLLDTPPHARRALIEKLSAGNDVRRAELEALLAECEREPALLSIPAADRFARLFESERRFPDALAERYIVTRELGRGGMATVYLARDVKHNRDVAVKVVLPVVANMLGAGRFLREIELVAQLRHPHIVPLFDSGEADGALYYVMPYEPGLSLRERLKRDHVLPADQVIVILRDICDALSYAHAQGVVHRDIKPDNVLLSGNHALVADFGIAKAARDAALQRDPDAGSALGTPMYMAPEQMLGDANIDHRVDIYAVGALAYELLAGHPPFTDTRRNRFLARLHDTPTPLTKRQPGVSAALSDLVMRCLQKRPSDRWQTADELLKQLESLSVKVHTAKESRRRRRWNRIVTAAAVVVGIAAISAIAWRSSRDAASWRNRWSRMHIEKLTDFAGSEVDAAISANGQLAAFLADRDSLFDAFVTRIGTGQFTNLTRGRFNQLLNEDVRNIGFVPDGDVWIRVADLNSPASVWITPVAGGTARPFLRTAVMAAYSPDGSRLAYHETTPGDPIFVANANGSNARRIFIGSGDQHAHHLTWSPDGRFIYFSHGLPPDEMDIWRLPASGGIPERITSQNSRLGYPVLVDDNTLLYTATADDGTGPWLYMMELGDRFPIRLSTGVEHFISIAASAEVPGQPRRLVATVSNPSVELWTIPLMSRISGAESATRLSLPTARSAAPRFARDFSLLYLASRSGADGLWRLSGTRAAEIWKPTDGAVTSAAAPSPDGKRICFVVRREQRSTLRCSLADGTGAAMVAESLDVRGAPSWSPDGKWIAVAAKDSGAVRVFKILLQDGKPQRLTDSVSSNPVWSPDGHFILYSGTSRGRSVPLNAVTPEGKPFALSFAPLLVDRLGDSYRFAPDGRSVVVKLGGFRRQDFWLIDVAT